MNVGVNSESHYGVPIHFLRGKISNSSKNYQFLSELKENYTYNQAGSLMIVNQSSLQAAIY